MEGWAWGALTLLPPLQGDGGTPLICNGLAHGVATEFGSMEEGLFSS